MTSSRFSAHKITSKDIFIENIDWYRSINSLSVYLTKQNSVLPRFYAQNNGNIERLKVYINDTHNYKRYINENE